MVDTPLYSASRDAAAGDSCRTAGDPSGEGIEGTPTDPDGTIGQAQVKAKMSMGKPAYSCDRIGTAPRHPGANRLYLRPHTRATASETTCIWQLDPMSSHECINGHPPADVPASIRQRRGARRGAGVKGPLAKQSTCAHTPHLPFPPQSDPDKTFWSDCHLAGGIYRRDTRTASPGSPADLVYTSKNTGVS